MKHKEVTDKILNGFYKVYNQLGYGFLEKVYQNALVIELRKLGLQVVCQRPIRVYYDDQVVGEFFADLVVDDRVVVELKAVRVLATEHRSQLLNYLHATTYEVGLLLNFGPKPEVKRLVFDNERKQYRSQMNTDKHRSN